MRGDLDFDDFNFNEMGLGNKYDDHDYDLATSIMILIKLIRQQVE